MTDGRVVVQEYLEKHAIQENLNSMLNDLAKERPDEPYVFMAKYIAEKFAESAVISSAGGVAPATSTTPVMSAGAAKEMAASANTNWSYIMGFQVPPGAAPAEGEGGDKQSKKQEKKDAKKDAKKEEKPKEDPRAKQLKKAIKEGGKKAQDIAGAADMTLGLEFYCTTIDEAQGDMEFLQAAMDGANVEVEPDSEERKGGSGHIGKMFFSAGIEKLTMVAYVPEALKEKINAKVWLEAVCKDIGGTVLKADGLSGQAEVAKDEDKGKFPLKDKDTGIASAIGYLKSKGCFPEDTGDDDDDEICFGDDAFDEMNAEYGY